ncbi:HNH endonuclease [Rhodococcus coprophilus]|uniref:HNH endonuclease n=1 Tax=Rhodococcus coprophilus TaxID=38310 RepID=UPI0037B0F04D
MSFPRWDDPASKHGTMVRGALWLVQVVGEGNVFTKDDLRKAFPGVSQVDRRIRDLRDYGWSIFTNTQDASLTPEDQRFVSAGVPVWNADARRAAAKKTVTAKERQFVMERDGFQCTICGIAGGEVHLDAANQVAVLAVAQRSVRGEDGETREMLVTLCKRCSSGDSEQGGSVGEVLGEFRGLDEVDRARFSRWAVKSQRGQTPLDRVWTAFRRLPAEARAEVVARIAGD